MLVHCLRRWTNIKAALAKRLVFAGIVVTDEHCLKSSKIYNIILLFRSTLSIIFIYVLLLLKIDYKTVEWNLYNNMVYIK